MKKMIAIALALAMMLTMFAGCGKTEPAETVPAQEMPASALEILETVWAKYDDSEKFSIVGGNIEANIMDAPGNYDLTYAENMTWNLLVPADKIANITEAASMIHMMNANTFTCGVFKIEGISAADFGAAMKDAVLNNQWMCGFPETLLIRSFGDSYVLMAFGINDAMTPFEQHLTEAYPGMETIANDPIV
jgi:predicted small lipoprotein YifL